MRIRVLTTTFFLLTAAAVYGQSRYNVPFGFQVGDNHFAAGWYMVSTNSLSSEILMLSQVGGGSIFIAPQSGIEAKAPTGAPTVGKLVFRCYGTTCFLSQVWRTGDSVGRQLRQSRAEREVASRTTQPPVYASVR